MNQDTESNKDLQLTPHEECLVSAYIDASEEAGNGLLGGYDLWFVALSLTCMWMFIDTGQDAWGYVGWIALISRMIHNHREGVNCGRVTASILRKYRTRLGELEAEDTKRARGRKPDPQGTPSQKGTGANRGNGEGILSSQTLFPPFPPVPKNQ